jgi:hypothetical protein
LSSARVWTRVPKLTKQMCWPQAYHALLGDEHSTKQSTIVIDTFLFFSKKFKEDNGMWMADHEHLFAIQIFYSSDAFWITDTYVGYSDSSLTVYVKNDFIGHLKDLGKHLNNVLMSAIQILSV